MGDVMPDDTVTLDFLARQSKQTLDEMRHIRKDLADMTKLVVSGYELTRRVERRQTELRDDIEIMVKMELSGSLANMQTSIENALGRLELTLEAVVERVDVLERRP